MESEACVCLAFNGNALPWLVLVLLVCVMPLGGCASRAVIPDHTVPHRVATEAVVQVWAQRADGRWVKTEVRLLEGWWIAAPQVVE